MKKRLLSLVTIISFASLFAPPIPQNYITAIKAEADKRLAKAETEITKNPAYMTPAQLAEYNDDLQTYSKAIEDAVATTPEEIRHNLQGINPWNLNLLTSKERTHILVISWMSKCTYDKFYAPYHETGKTRHVTTGVKTRVSGEAGKFEHLSWVTIPYETKSFIQKFKANNPHASTQDLQKRLTQRFGLPPEEPGHYADKVFVELWVKPEDLMRPCINNNLLSNSCAADLFPNTPREPFEDLFAIAGETDRKYINWYKEERSKKYTEWFIPWTRLGYTFDWGTDFQSAPQKAPEKGSTEFIIKPGSEVIIERAISTDKYTMRESEV